MKVQQLIKRLQGMDPDAEVVLFSHQGPQGYNKVNFLMGTHEGHPDAKLHSPSDYWLKENRAKWVKGETRPDFLWLEPGSRAKRIPFVVLS